MAALSMDGAVRVKRPPREKLHPLYSDPHDLILDERLLGVSTSPTFLDKEEVSFGLC